MTAATSLLPVLFLIAAYIGLRWKKDSMKRDFKFGNRAFGITVGIFLMAVFMFVFFMSTVPEPTLIKQAIAGTLPEGTANPIGTLVYNVLGVVVFVGLAWICWIRYEKKSKKNLEESK